MGKFLVGNRKERVVISRLMTLEKPAFVDYDYVYLCQSFASWLYENSVRSSVRFDETLAEFLDYLELDIRERHGYDYSSFSAHLLHV